MSTGRRESSLSSGRIVFSFLNISFSAHKINAGMAGNSIDLCNHPIDFTLFPSLFQFTSIPKFSRSPVEDDKHVDEHLVDEAVHV